MISELTTTTLVEWSRWQFAMTAIYHYMFVPLTLGLSFLLAIMETMWVRTGKAEWLNATKFWMKLFAINFAIGIATGLILEFQFGSNISALWILVANAWMQNPVGMEFNPMTARNEMSDFWAVLLSPTAMSKFFHTVTSAYTLSACFVVGVSAWFILKKRHFEFARKSILLASVFGFLSIIATIFTGDTSAQDVTRTQPMKLAAMEGLNEGGKGAPFTLIGLTCTDPQLPSERMKTVKYGITIPKLLSFLGYHDFDAYVPGIQNIMDGYTSEDGKVYPSIEQRMANGRLAIDALKTYKQAVKDKNDALASQSLQTLRANFQDFGYGYLSSPYDTIPPVPLVFYSFRLMVGLGMLFVLLFICSWWYAKKRKFEKFKFIPYLAIACVPLAYIASQCGWIVAEVGRQPWVVQNLMPTNVAITRIASGWVVTTFWMFAILFTLLLIAEIGIMFTQIRKGVKE